MQTVTKAVLAERVRSRRDLEPADYSDFARAQTRRHILGRLEEMLRYQDSLQDPDDRQRHHAMRIAAKRLRYTVEIAKPVYGPALDEIITAVKKVQTLLGDIHDCDVWLEHLDAYAADERRRTVASPARPAGSPAWKPASTTSAKSAAATANRSSRKWSTTGGSCGSRDFGTTWFGLWNRRRARRAAARRRASAAASAQPPAPPLSSATFPMTTH